MESPLGCVFVSTGVGADDASPFVHPDKTQAKTTATNTDSELLFFPIVKAYSSLHRYNAFWPGPSPGQVQIVPLRVPLTGRCSTMITWDQQRLHLYLEFLIIADSSR